MIQMPLNSTNNAITINNSRNMSDKLHETLQFREISETSKSLITIKDFESEVDKDDSKYISVKDAVKKKKLEMITEVAT